LIKEQKKVYFFQKITYFSMNFFLEKENLRKNTKENFKWPEDVLKQKYDLKNQSKIGFTSTPFIKKIQEKNFDEKNEKHLKIGNPEKPVLLHKDKAVQLKIGHGNPEFLGKK